MTLRRITSPFGGIGIATIDDDNIIVRVDVLTPGDDSHNAGNMETVVGQKASGYLDWCGKRRESGKGCDELCGGAPCLYRGSGFRLYD
jgi:hypothetical protein